MALRFLLQFAREKWSLLALGAIVICAAGLRISLLSESLWIDELHTAWTVNGTFGEVFSRAKMGNQGPVYFIALWLWTHIFGLSEISLRLPSWIAGVALPAVVYWNVKRFEANQQGQSLAALLAAFFAATDPYAIFYSQEARPYAWVILGSVMHFCELASWLRRPQKGQMMRLVIGAALLFYLHFTTFLLFAAEAAFAVCVVGLQNLNNSAAKRSQLSLRQLLMLPVLVALCCLPAIPSLQLLAERIRNWEAFVGTPSLIDLFWMFPAALAVFIIAVKYVGLAIRGEPKDKRSSAASPFVDGLELAAILWLFVPLSIAWLASFWEVARLFFPRYLVAALPASWILAGQSTRVTSFAVGRYVLAGALVVLWCGRPEVIDSVRGNITRDEDWRAAVDFVNQHYAVAPGTIYVNAALIEAPRPSDEKQTASADLQEYLLLPVGSLYQLQAGDVRPLFFTITVPEKGPLWFIVRNSDGPNWGGDEALGNYPVRRQRTKFEKRFGKVSVLCLIPLPAEGTH